MTARALVAFWRIVIAVALGVPAASALILVVAR